MSSCQEITARKEIAPRSARRLVAAQPQLLKTTEAILGAATRHVHARKSPHLYPGIEPLRSANRSGRHPNPFSQTVARPVGAQCLLFFFVVAAPHRRSTFR